MINVGVDFHAWSGIYQGTRAHFVGLYRAAILAAPDMNFIFFGENLQSLHDEYDEFRQPNVHLVRMRKTRAFWRLLVQLPLLAWKHRLTVLHTQYRIPPLAPCLRACTIHDLLVETHREFFPRRFAVLARWMLRYSARQADLLFTVSEFSKGELSRFYNVPPDRIAVTSNGVDFSRFNPEAIDHRVLAKYGITHGRYWLTVGRIEPRKNQVNIIKAWTQRGDFTKPLVIVGQQDFDYDEAYREAIASDGAESIVFLDGVADKELPALYSSCYCFIYPSYAEGFGMPIVEALSCGAPVITSRSTAMPEVVGTAAVTVDPHSVDEIMFAMAAVDASGETRAARVQQARKYPWNRAAVELVSGFRALACSGVQ